MYIKGERLKCSAIAKIGSKAVCKYLLQFDRLVLSQGVLHWLFIINDVELHQLVLPTIYHYSVLSIEHGDHSHQDLDHTLALARERSVLCTKI